MFLNKISLLLCKGCDFLNIPFPLLFSVMGLLCVFIQVLYGLKAAAGHVLNDVLLGFI